MTTHKRPTLIHELKDPLAKIGLLLLDASPPGSHGNPDRGKYRFADFEAAYDIGDDMVLAQVSDAYMTGLQRVAEALTGEVGTDAVNLACEAYTRETGRS